MLENQVIRVEVRVDWLLLSCWKPCLPAKRFCPCECSSGVCPENAWESIFATFGFDFFVFKLWIWENGQLFGKTDVGATFVWLYFHVKKLRENWKKTRFSPSAFCKFLVVTDKNQLEYPPSFNVWSWVWFLVWSDAKDVFGILCKSNKTLPRSIH